GERRTGRGRLPFGRRSGPRRVLARTSTASATVAVRFFEHQAYGLATDLRHQSAPAEFVGQQLQRPACASLGWWPTADGDQVRFDVAIDLGWYWRGQPGLAFQGRLLAIADEAFADAGYGIDVHAQGAGNLGIDPRAFRTVAIGKQQNAGMAS